MCSFDKNLVLIIPNRNYIRVECSFDKNLVHIDNVCHCLIFPTFAAFRRVFVHIMTEEAGCEVCSTLFSSLENYFQGLCCVTFAFKSWSSFVWNDVTGESTAARAGDEILDAG